MQNANAAAIVEKEEKKEIPYWQLEKVYKIEVRSAGDWFIAARNVAEAIEKLKVKLNDDEKLAGVLSISWLGCSKLIA